MPKSKLSQVERFWNKVIIKENGYKTPCWVWTASTNSMNYGHMNVSGKTIAAHRWAYEHFVGRIPEGLELDHMCRNTLCVNPSHCRAVTHKQNVLCGGSPSALNAIKTHCPKGHEYIDNNIIVVNGKWRRCRICVNEYGKNWRLKNKCLIQK